jgi:hypothetical protein
MIDGFFDTYCGQAMRSNLGHIPERPLGGLIFDPFCPSIGPVDVLQLLQLHIGYDQRQARAPVGHVDRGTRLLAVQISDVATGHGAADHAPDGAENFVAIDFDKKSATGAVAWCASSGGRNAHQSRSPRVFGEQLPQKIGGRDADDDEVACGHKEAVPDIIFVVVRFHLQDFLPMTAPDAPKPLMKASVHLLNIYISDLTSICQESFSLVSPLITQANGEQPCAGGLGAQPGGVSLKRLLTISQRPCSGWSADAGQISPLL